MFYYTRGYDILSSFSSLTLSLTIYCYQAAEPRRGLLGVTSKLMRPTSHPMSESQVDLVKKSSTFEVEFKMANSRPVFFSCFFFHLKIQCNTKRMVSFSRMAINSLRNHGQTVGIPYAVRSAWPVASSTLQGPVDSLDGTIT